MDFRFFLERFVKDRRGNLAMITMICFVPISMIAAGAVDFGMQATAKAASQTALDSALLAAAASQSTSLPALEAIATKVYAQNIIGTAAASSSINVSTFAYNSVTKQLAAQTTGVYHPMFVSFIGFSQLDYQARAQTLQQTSGTLEVALVLDNTYSMTSVLGSGTRLSVLKTAATGLVSTVMTTQNAGFVKVGVVPYGDYVDVGVANRGASWLNIPADYSTSTTTPSTCTTATTKTTTTCTGGTKTTCTSSTTHDGITTTTTSSCTTGQTCTSTTTPLSPAVTTCTTAKTTTTNYAWYGCVLPQWGTTGIAMPVPSAPYTAPALTTSSNCLSAITPLTTTAATVNTAINAMVDQVSSYYPNTYIPGGLLWGINILAPGGPLSQGAAYDPKNKQPRKAIVLMTDGFNTDWLTSAGFKGVGGAGGTTAQEATAYADEQALCVYAKSKNIEIYTIGVGVTDATSLSNLQSCATDSSHYFDVQTDTGLTAAFNTIAGSLQNLRISN